MTRPPRLDAAGTLTHIIARGNERRPLFRDDADRERYLDLLAESLRKARRARPRVLSDAEPRASGDADRVRPRLPCRARRPLAVRALLQPPLRPLRAPFSGAVPGPARRSRRLPPRGGPLHPQEPGEGEARGAAAGLRLVESRRLPRLGAAMAGGRRSAFPSRGKPSEGATPLPGVRRRNGRGPLRPGRRAPRRSRRGRRLRTRGALESGPGRPRPAYAHRGVHRRSPSRSGKA